MFKKTSTKPNRFYQKKSFRLYLASFFIICAFRISLPYIAKYKINHELRDISPTINGHIQDVDLGIVAGGFDLNEIEFKIKKTDVSFMKIRSIHTDLSWRRLLHGSIELKSIIKGMDFTYSNDLAAAIKVRKQATKKEIPSYLHVARVDIEDSVLRLSGYPSLTLKNGTLITGISGRITNLLPRKEVSESFFEAHGLVLESGKLKMNGHMNFLKSSPTWSAEGEIKNFNLTEMNQFLYKKIPITFTKGWLDLYSELKTENSQIKGYIKPFIKDLDVIRSNEKFKSAKHWFLEIVTAFANLSLESHQVAATKIPFTYNSSGLHVQTSEAVANLIKHGFIREENQGADHKIQAEEE